MTPLQSNLYRAVCAWWDEYEFGPTLSDLQFVLMWKAKRNVQIVADALVKKGLLTRERYVHRSLRPSGRGLVRE
jgi:hypothetical protein